MWFSVCLVHLIHLMSNEGCTLSGQEETIIERTETTGHSVLLPCSCTDLQTRPASFLWEFNEQDTSDWVSVTQNYLYRGRVKLFNETTPGNLSLLLSHLTGKSQGYYRCRIQSSPPEQRNIHLTVSACTLARTLQSIVESVGQSVTLLCSCTEPHRRPASLKWEFSASSTGPWLPVAQRGLYRKLNENTLILSSLSKEDQGYYRCKGRNGGFKDFFLTVQGTPVVTTKGPSKETPSSSNLFIYIYVGLPLILIISGVAVCLYMKNKGRKTIVDEDGVNKREGRGGGERNQEDILTYSTIVHTEGGRRAAVSMMDQNGQTEYATVR